MKYFTILLMLAHSPAESRDLLQSVKQAVSHIPGFGPKTTTAGLRGTGANRELTLINRTGNAELGEAVVFRVPEDAKVPSEFSEVLARHYTAPTVKNGIPLEDSIRLAQQASTAARGNLIVSGHGSKVAREYAGILEDGKAYRGTSQIVRLGEIHRLDGYDAQAYTTWKLSDDGRTINRTYTNPSGPNQTGQYELPENIEGRILDFNFDSKELDIVLLTPEGELYSYRYYAGDHFAYGPVQDGYAKKPFTVSRLTTSEAAVYKAKVIPKPQQINNNPGSLQLETVGAAR